MRLALALVALLAGPAIADVPKPEGTKQAPTKGKKQRKPRPVMQPSAPTDGDADGDGLKMQPDRPAPKTQHKEGDYGGVTPGQSPTESKGKKKVPPKSTLTWIGFEAKSGGAEVFFQAAAPFTVTQHVEGAVLVAELDLPRLGANTWRQVDTRYFENPLSGIVAKAHKNKIEVRFTFKNPADAKEASMRTNTEADGMYYTYLSFPQGTAAPDAAPPKKDVEK